MRYEWTTVLLIPDAAHDAAEAVGQQITGGAAGEIGETAAPTYAVALSANGNTPVQFWACCTAVNAAMLGQMQTVLQSGVLPGVRYWRWSSQWGVLVSTNAPVSQNRLGEEWGWERCLNDAGLRIVGGAGF